MRTKSAHWSVRSVRISWAACSGGALGLRPMTHLRVAQGPHLHHIAARHDLTSAYRRTSRWRSQNTAGNRPPPFFLYCVSRHLLQPAEHHTAPGRARTGGGHQAPARATVHAARNGPYCSPLGGRPTALSLAMALIYPYSSSSTSPPARCTYEQPVLPPPRAQRACSATHPDRMVRSVSMEQSDPSGSSSYLLYTLRTAFGAAAGV